MSFMWCTIDDYLKDESIRFHLDEMMKVVDDDCILVESAAAHSPPRFMVN